MSYLNTKQALIQQLKTVASVDDVAFENKEFNPEGKQFWYAAYFRPATSESNGKTLESSDLQYGFFQVSVFVPRNLDSFDNLIYEKTDLILGAFKETTSVSYNGQIVDILDHGLNDNSSQESWFRKDITINYLTFSEK